MSSYYENDAGDKACPYLGSLNGPDNYWPDPTVGNRCYAFDAPTSIDELEQRGLCLSGDYMRCPRLAASRKARMNAEQMVAPRRSRSPWVPLSIVAGGLASMAMLLVCAVVLIMYQAGVGGTSVAAGAISDVGGAINPSGGQSPVNTDGTAMSGAETTNPASSGSPTETSGMIATATPAQMAPAQMPTFTRLVPTPMPTWTPRSQAVPTSRPASTPQSQAIWTPRPTYTRAATFTPRATLTPRATYTRYVTRTPTSTRTPTPIVYGPAFTISQPTQQVAAGQDTTFNVVAKNRASRSDNISFKLDTALMEGWSAKLYVDGADRGSGPVTIPLAALASKTIVVKVTTSSEAAAGDAGEVYLSGLSQTSAGGTGAVTLTVVVK